MYISGSPLEGKLLNNYIIFNYNQFNLNYVIIYNESFYKNTFLTKRKYIKKIIQKNNEINIWCIIYI